MYDTSTERGEIKLYDGICKIAYNKASLKLWQVEHSDAEPASL